MKLSYEGDITTFNENSIPMKSTLVSAGGNSGCPIFDKLGRVLAILNGGKSVKNDLFRNRDNWF